MNNIKKGLIILSLASVCVAGFAATKPVPQPLPQPVAGKPSPVQSAPQPVAPQPVAPQPVAPIKKK